jgi:hypothetical protein
MWVSGFATVSSSFLGLASICFFNADLFLVVYFVPRDVRTVLDYSSVKAATPPGFCRDSLRMQEQGLGRCFEEGLWSTLCSDGQSVNIVWHSYSRKTSQTIRNGAAGFMALISVKNSNTTALVLSFFFVR